MAKATVQVTLTHDEWVLLLNALHGYASATEDEANEGFPEGSRGWTAVMEIAREANTLHSKLALLFGDSA